jgi:hypothetical protein
LIQQVDDNLLEMILFSYILLYCIYSQQLISGISVKLFGRIPSYGKFFFLEPSFKPLYANSDVFNDSSINSQNVTNIDAGTDRNSTSNSEIELPRKNKNIKLENSDKEVRI